MKESAVYLLTGEGYFLKDEFIKDLKNKFLEKSDQALNFISSSAEDSKIEDILAAARTPPFLSKKRVVVIKDIDRLDEKGRSSLLAFVKNPTETTCLILESTRPLLEDEFLSSISRRATLIRIQAPRYGALNHWIKKRASFFNKKITEDATELLKELTGDNLELISREIEKAVSFVGNKNDITTEDIERITGRSIRENIFILVDYIGRKDTSQSILLCRRLLQQGKKVHEIIGLIGWHFRRALSVKLALEKGKKKELLLREFGFRQFQLEKLIKLLDNFKADELRRKLKLLFIADRAIKTSPLKPEFILDILISRLCTTYI